MAGSRTCAVMQSTEKMVGWYHYGVLQLKQEKMLFTAHCTLSRGKMVRCCKIHGQIGCDRCLFFLKDSEERLLIESMTCWRPRVLSRRGSPLNRYSLLLTCLVGTSLVGIIFNRC